MSMSNYLRWVAQYPTFSIVEDQSIADHFLKLIPQQLVSLYYQDGNDHYRLLARTGEFAINDYLITTAINGVTLKPAGTVNKQILRPSQEHELDGVFQYKHCVADNGARGTSAILGTYNLGFRKTIGDTIVYQKLIIDSFTGDIFMELQLTNTVTLEKSHAKNKIDVPRTRTSIVV